MLDRPLTSYHLILGATALLLALGLTMVLSASSVTSYRQSGSSFAVFQKQAIWLAAGLPMLWIASRLPVRVYRRLAYPALLSCLVLLALVPVLGVEINGNRNWIAVGGFKIQPSEPAKLALVIWGADLLARKQRLLGHSRHLIIPLVPIGVLLIGLVLLGDDLGTSLVLIGILFALLFFAGAPMRLFGAALFLGGLAVTIMAQASQNRAARILSWLDPSSAAASWNYQALHGKYALASGGLWGLGLGASREKWGALPEAHNDFIFAVLGEELGLIGTLAVLALFGAIAVAGLRIALRATDPFVRLATAGVTVWVTVQALVNIAVVVGLLPVIGLPLPLVSYGGSALLPTMIALGMLLSFARAEFLGQVARATTSAKGGQTAREPRVAAGSGQGRGQAVKGQAVRGRKEPATRSTAVRDRQRPRASAPPGARPGGTPRGAPVPRRRN